MSTPTHTLPPNTIVIYQTLSAVEAMIEYPLIGVGFKAGQHYLVTSSISEAREMLDGNTVLLVVGAHQSGGTEGLEELISHARGLNPTIRVVGYSACDLGSLLLDEFISKMPIDPIENLRLLLEVACAIDKVRDADQARQIFEGLKGS